MRESQERSGGKSTTITRAHRVEFKRRSGSLNNYLDCRTPFFYALSPWIINRCNEARTSLSSKQLSINHPAAYHFFHCQARVAAMVPPSRGRRARPRERSIASARQHGE